jgi:hypothetical protein
MEDDPKRPYKMYAAVVAVVVTSFLSSEGLELSPVVVAILTAVAAGAAVFGVRNPKL